MKRLFIFIIVLPVAILSIWGTVQYFAPPPTLNPKRSKAYEPIITFAEHHKDWEFIYAETQYFMVTNYDNSLSYSERKDIMHKFENWLEGTSTIRVYRKYDLIFFTSEPQFPLMWTPSYIYSPRGVDPRKEYDYLLNTSRPFYPIGDHWYYSKNMSF